MVKLVLEGNVDVPEENEEENKEGFKSCHSLLILIKQRLQHILKMLVKFCLTKPPVNKDCPKLGEIYKACYVKTFELEEGVKRDEFIKKLHTVLTHISDKVAEYNRMLF